MVNLERSRLCGHRRLCAGGVGLSIIRLGQPYLQQVAAVQCQRTFRGCRPADISTTDLLARACLDRTCLDRTYLDECSRPKRAGPDVLGQACLVKCSCQTCLGRMCLAECLARMCWGRSTTTQPFHSRRNGASTLSRPCPPHLPAQSTSHLTWVPGLGRFDLSIYRTICRQLYCSVVEYCVRHATATAFSDPYRSNLSISAQMPSAHACYDKLFILRCCNRTRPVTPVRHPIVTATVVTCCECVHRNGMYGVTLPNYGKRLHSFRVCLQAGSLPLRLRATNTSPVARPERGSYTSLARTRSGIQPQLVSPITGTLMITQRPAHSHRRHLHEQYDGTRMRRGGYVCDAEHGFGAVGGLYRTR